MIYQQSSWCILYVYCSNIYIKAIHLLNILLIVTGEINLNLCTFAWVALCRSGNIQHISCSFLQVVSWNIHIVRILLYLAAHSHHTQFLYYFSLHICVHHITFICLNWHKTFLAPWSTNKSGGIYCLPHCTMFQ